MIEWIKNGFRSLFNWLRELWDSFVTFLQDLALLVLDGILSAVASLIETLPVPTFLSNGLGFYINAIDGSILYFLSRSGMSEALLLLGAGFSFRMLRKLFTLGRW